METMEVRTKYGKEFREIDHIEIIGEWEPHRPIPVLRSNETLIQTVSGLPIIIEK